MKRAVIYTRFSPRRNADESESCETQETLCREYAKTKGYSVASVYADKDKSGSDPNRPELRKAIGALGREDVLVVYKRDRLARDVLIAELTRRQVKAKGASIEAVKGDVEGDDPYLNMVRQVLDAVAELERKVIGERTSDAMKVHQQKGKRMGRYAPYGWMIDPDDNTRIIRNETEQLGVMHIKALADSGETVAAITAIMKEHYMTLARNGKWTAKTISKTINRERNRE